MTTIWGDERRVKEQIANAGVPSRGKKAPPQEKVPIGCQVAVIHLVMKDGNIMKDFLNLTEVITTQAQLVTTQGQATMAQASREVETCVIKNSSTVTFRLTYFTRINPSMFLGLT